MGNVAVELRQWNVGGVESPTLLAGEADTPAGNVQTAWLCSCQKGRAECVELRLAGLPEAMKHEAWGLHVVNAGLVVPVG